MNSEIVKPILADQLVREKPEIYWGKPDPSIVDVTEAVVEQLKLEACINIEVVNEGRWTIVSSETDWMKNVTSNEEESLESLFHDARGLSVVGGNALRVEYFLYLYVSELIAWSGGEITKIKGEVTDVDIQNYIKDYLPSKYCVCFNK